jgi:formylglycine-generating enzyme required for sulfatase activity
VSRIFLSHSSENNAEAVAVHDWMIANGWDDLFLDLSADRGLKAGERWQEALKRAAERCELVVFLVSPIWAASKWCLAEFLLAKSLNKRIFAVIVQPTAFAELPTEMTSEWQITDLTTGPQDYHATVKLPGGGSAEVAFGSEGLNRLRIGLMQSGLDPKYFVWPPANDPGRPLYRGLKPLEGDDAGIFFGREAQVLDVLDRLRGLRAASPPRLLVILAASGAGKSSLLRAGLWPRLARDDRQFLLLPIIRPGRLAISGETGLLHAMEAAFRSANLSVARADLREAIEEGGARLRGLLSQLVREAPQEAADGGVAPKACTLVLGIDQGEELFLAEGQVEAETFLRLLRDLLMADRPDVIALFAIRSDNYERLQLAKELDGVRQQTVSLPPMPRGSYADVIKGPPRRLEGTSRALTVDDALVDSLLADLDAGGAKDSLPLLAFTLERLYGEYGAAGHLKLEHYQKLGRIEGAIEAAVERAFRAGDDDRKVPNDRQVRLALLRRGLIPWLAGIDPDTGAPRRRVARRSEIPDEARPLVDLLIEQRLLSTDVDAGTKEKTIEPAHEALLRQWGLLQSWLKEDAALLAVLDGVKGAARDWAANGKAGAWLGHSEQRLRAAERLLTRADLAANLEPTDKEYVAACQAAERAARAWAQRRVALVGGLFCLLAVGGVAWWKQDFLKEQYRWRWVMGASVLTSEQEKNLRPRDEFADCKVGCPKMIVLKDGEFMMGDADWQHRKSDMLEGPPQRVTISRPFAVSKTEVTVAGWIQCVSAHACDARPLTDYGRVDDAWPVTNVSWNQAQTYVKWLSRLTGRRYRLLSEAEWEYSARAGSPDAYSFGDDATQLGGYAWYIRNSGNKPHTVGAKRANDFGLEDMYGNVEEWVQDTAHDNYDGAPHDGRPWDTDGNQSRRIVRGGSYKDPADKLRSASRDAGTADRPYPHVGFRVARDLD